MKLKKDYKLLRFLWKESIEPIVFTAPMNRPAKLSRYPNLRQSMKKFLLDLERPSLCPSPSNCRIGSALSAFWANFCFSRCYFKILNLKIEINSCDCGHTGSEIAIEAIGLDSKKSFLDYFVVLFSEWLVSFKRWY